MYALLSVTSTASAVSELAHIPASSKYVSVTCDILHCIRNITDQLDSIATVAHDLATIANTVSMKYCAVSTLGTATHELHATCNHVHELHLSTATENIAHITLRYLRGSVKLHVTKSITCNLAYKS
jgi:hypothetical protein